MPPVSTYHHPHPYVNTWTVGAGSGDYTNQPLGLDYMNHANLGNIGNLKPPPQYPGASGVAGMAKNSNTPGGATTDIRTCRSYETMDKVMDMSKFEDTRSHPDLRLCASTQGGGVYANSSSALSSGSPQRSANTSADESSDSQMSIAAKASQMVEMLTGENRGLREELAQAQVKVARLHRVSQGQGVFLEVVKL